MPERARPPLPKRWFRSGQPSFVGRGQELRALEDVWSAVMAGAGGAVFVGGEPGAGKSRFVEEVAITLLANGAAVLAGSCIAELGAPYEPFDEPIRLLLSAMDETRLVSGSAATPSESMTRQLLENVAGGDQSATAGESSDVASRQRHLYDAVVGALREASVASPLVLVLEDMQWAGTAAVQLMSYVVERATESRILLLVTERTSLPDRSTILTRTIAGLQRLDGVRRLELPPLTANEITEYISREAHISTGEAHAPAIALRYQSGGNPFFLRELWRDLQARGGISTLDTQALITPESIRDSLDARLANLTASQLTVLEMAAVLGQEFEVSELVAASNAITEEAVKGIDDALKAAIQARLLTSDASFHFAHAIARQSLLDRIPPYRLARLHVQIAETLEAQFPAVPRLVQRLAHHYASAHSPAYSSRAVHYLVAAATAADRGLAHQDAVELLERAAETTLTPAERDDLRLRAARSCTLASDFARARALNEQVAALADPRRRLRAAIGYEVASWRPGLLGHRAVELLTEALAGVETNPSDPLYVRALSALARAAAFTGATRDGAELGDRAIRMARALGDEDLLAATLKASLTQSLRPAQLTVRLRQADELTTLARSSGDIENLGGAANCRGAAHYILGDHEGMTAAEHDLNHAANESSGGYWSYWAGCLRFGRQFADGRLGDAERSSQRLQVAQKTFGSDRTDGPFGLQSYMIRRETCRLEPVRRLVTGDESPTRHWAPGLLAIFTELRMQPSARRLLAWMLDDEDGVADHDSADWPAQLAFMVEAALWLEDPAAARRLRPLVGEYTRVNMMAGFFVAVFGSADRYIGALDALTGSGSPEDSFAAALALDERTGARLHQAQTLATHAEYLHRRGADSLARDLTTRARSIAEARGLSRVLLGLDRRRAEDLSHATNGLTAREIEVVRLLGSGMSNREIAAHLVISENTAANHVRNILTKTGAANRTKAAIYASDHGLLK